MNNHQSWNIPSVLFALIIGLALLFIYVGISGPVGIWDKWFLIVGVLMLVSFLIYAIREKQKSSKIEAQKAEAIVALKGRADQVKVPLNNLKIKANSWSSEEVIDHSKYAGLNDLIGEGQRNIKKVNHNHSTIIFKIPYKGKIIKHTESFDIDEKTLQMFLGMQGETICYVDPQDRNAYYLDLEFLSSDA